MSAVRFPIAEGSVIACEEQTHQAGYMRPTRLAVRHVVAYYEAEPGVSISVQMANRQQPLRVMVPIDEFDRLMAEACVDAEVDVVR